MRSNSCLIAFVCLAATTAYAQDLAARLPPNPAASSNDVTVRTIYLLGANDQLRVRVADVPDIGAEPVRIDPAGDIRLPMVGAVRAAGRTIEALEVELVERLKSNIQEPDVSVSVVEFQSQPVSVLGAVQTSGVHQVQGAKTLIEMLSLAGGISESAGPTVRVTRRLEWGRIPLQGAVEDSSGAVSVAEINLKTLLAATSPEQNIIVRPNDVISIPPAEVVFVVGEVGRPGPVPLSGRSVSVMEALSSSGGMLRTASSGNARLLRKQTGTETRTEVEVDLKKIMEGSEKDLPMVAGDILVVPDAPGRRVMGRVLELSIAAGISVGLWALLND